MNSPESSNSNPASPEQAVVGSALSLVYEELDDQQREEYDFIVSVTSMFSRKNDEGFQTLSPSKIKAIPVITADYVHKQQPAAGKVLAPHELLVVWGRYTPANDGTRHPDQLFEVARDQFNWDETTLRQAVDEIMSQPPAQDPEV